jgi:hypothetical protein
MKYCSQIDTKITTVLILGKLSLPTPILYHPEESHAPERGVYLPMRWNHEYCRYTHNRNQQSKGLVETQSGIGIRSNTTQEKVRPRYLEIEGVVALPIKIALTIPVGPFVKRNQGAIHR